MDDGIDDYTRSSRFVVICTDEEKIALLAQDWDSMKQIVMDCLWDGPDPPEDVREVMAALGDADEWAHDDFGPFHFATGLGDGHLSIYRIQN